MWCSYSRRDPASSLSVVLDRGVSGGAGGSGCGQGGSGTSAAATCVLGLAVPAACVHCAQ